MKELSKRYEREGKKRVKERGLMEKEKQNKTHTCGWQHGHDAQTMKKVSETLLAVYMM